MRKLCWASSFAVVVGLFGCTDFQPNSVTEPESAAGPLVAASEVSSLQRIYRPSEQAALDLARLIPGYGGHFLDSEGTLVVRAKDQVAAQSRVADISDRVFGTSRQFQPKRATGTVRVEQADFTFLELRDFRDGLFRMLALPGVVGLDLDEERNRVQFGVLVGERSATVAQVLAEMERSGVPLGAVEFEDVLESGDDVATFASPLALPNTSLSSAHDTLKAGLMISWHLQGGASGGCTIGWTTYTDFRQFDEAFVTGTHCSSGWGELEATAYWQPTFSGAAIGVEYDDQQWWKCTPDGAILCVWADANIVKTQGRPVRPNTIAQVIPWTTTINPSHPVFDVVGEVASSLMGMDVVLMGAQTGVSAGYIVDTCYDRQNGMLVYLCQDGGSYIRQNGDSGGAVFTPTDPYVMDEVLLMGIHSGYKNGKAYFSPMSQVRIAFPDLVPLFH